MAKRKWKEKHRSLNTPLGRAFIKRESKKLQKKGFTYKVETMKQWCILYQGRKRQ